MKIVCKNGEEEVTFGFFPPFWLENVTGLGADYAVYTSKTNDDGESYSSSSAAKRNIVITLDIEKRVFAENRSKLYNFFQPRVQGTLFYYEGSIERKISYYVEKLTPSGTSNDAVQHMAISLICPDPKFYDVKENCTALAEKKGLLKFPIVYKSPCKISEKLSTLICNIINGSSVPMGLKIIFSASGNVEEPSLSNVYTGESLKVNTTMILGDVITITTFDGHKKITLTRNGVTTNINNLVDYPPCWLKANRGDNLFRYNAKSGIVNLEVLIKTNQSYWGV